MCNVGSVTTEFTSYGKRRSMSTLHRSQSYECLRELDRTERTPTVYVTVPNTVEKKPSIRKKPILHSGRVSRKIQSEIRKWRLICRQKREILRCDSPSIEDQLSGLTLNPAVPIEPIKLWSPSFFDSDDVEL